MTRARLTYCGNVHPAEDLDAWCASVERFSVPVAARQPGPFGLGAWWSAGVAHALATDEGARARVRALLAREGLELWTLNVFPTGGFHDARVKERVYRPDWGSDERLRYTIEAATAAAALGAPGGVVPLSTLPLGFGTADLRRAAQNLARAAQAFADLEAESGVRCVLALEPEPFCLLETAAQTAAFLEDHVFARAGAGAPEATLRRHVGVCIDLCHLAVVREAPRAALDELDRRGIAVPKIQVSSCLELRDPAALDRLLAFDEPRYLHQSIADDGTRALDLGDVRRRAAEFARAGRIRTHFHMPIFWDADPLGSTRGEIAAFLPALAGRDAVLEIETYTWSVLDRAIVGADDLVDGLCQELAFARGRMRS